jgi:RNase H-fold protein (predicted Holliday junction resolvase)
MRIVGLDVGERRIGVAVSDATGTLARPVGVLRAAALDAEARCRVWRPKRTVSSTSSSAFHGALMEHRTR